MLVVNLFENNPYHPYEGNCPKCFENGSFMSDNAFRFQLFAKTFNLMVLGMYFKSFIWHDYKLYWNKFFKNFRVLLFRIIVSLFMVLPAIIMALVKIKVTWIDLLYSFLMGVLFAFNFLFLQRWFYKFTRCDVLGDFFNQATKYEDIVEI